MSGALDPGRLAIDVTLVSGRVVSASVGSTRPIGLARMLVGRRTQEAPALVGRLFSLCGRSQAAAARLAIAAAEGRPQTLTRLETTGLMAERIGEYLRAETMAAVREGALPDPASLARLRAAMAAARDALALAESDPRNAAPAAARRLVEAADACRVAVAKGEDDAPAMRPDGLGAADDAAVVAALRADQQGFAAMPALPGRCVETGAFARHWAGLDPALGLEAARAEARRCDFRETLAGLAAVATDAEAPLPDLAASASLGAGEGYAAVESPRGRLYHLARCTGGMVTAYAILAPTEWNFHPSGPFVATLKGMRLGEAGVAQARVERLAALFDPCVTAQVTIREAAHA